MRGHRPVVLTGTTPQGEAVGELSDVYPWGRYRVAGTSTPPFAVLTEVTA